MFEQKVETFNNLDPKGRKVILDLETTGLDYQFNKIVEVGMLEMIDDVPTGSTWFMKFNSEGVEFEKETEQILGYTHKDIENEPYIRDHIHEIRDYIGDSTVVIHNSSFDIQYINGALEEVGLQKLKNPLIDTIVLARGYLKPTKASLDFVAEHFMVQNNRGKYHNALEDCKLLASLYPFIVNTESARKMEQPNLMDYMQMSDEEEVVVETKNYDSVFIEKTTKKEEKLFLEAWGETIEKQKEL